MNKDFMEFAERVRGNIESTTGKKVKLQAVRKNNSVVLYGITIFNEDWNVAPTIYLEKFYEMYKEGEQLGDIIAEIIRFSEHETISESVDMRFFEDYEQVKPLLGFKLVNADMNAALLQEVPHKRIFNFAVVCYCDIPLELCLGRGSILIRNEHLAMWDISEEELLEGAMQNMQEMNPAELMNMSEVLKRLYDDPEELLVSKLPMWVLTTEVRTFGASALLYDNQLEKVAEEIKDDFYVLPSSIHEVIILPKKYGTNINYLVQMVHEINQEQLDMEERLADNIYFYQRENKELQIIF